jgi:hypothetical protein
MKYNNASQAAAIALSIAARARKAIRSSQPSIENLTPNVAVGTTQFCQYTWPILLIYINRA